MHSNFIIVSFQLIILWQQLVRKLSNFEFQGASTWHGNHESQSKNNTNMSLAHMLPTLTIYGFSNGSHVILSNILKNL